MSSLNLSQNARRGIAAALLTAAALVAVACTDDATQPNLAGTRYGVSQALGAGTARTYVTLDAAGNPTSVGVALSEAALTNLPMTLPHFDFHFYNVSAA
ncbi:MAG: DUF5602 domain-containing protein [Gemmatimonas sp.]